MTNFSSGYDIDFLPSNRLIAPVARERQSLTFPKNTSRRSTAWLFALIIAVGLTLTPHKTSAAGYTANDIVSGTNTVRQENNLATLNVDAKLTSAAEAKAADMFARQYFNHYSPTGQAPWVWVQQSGYAFTSAGENLAIDFADGPDVIDAWMHSTTHRQNLLSPKFTDIGVAVVDGVMNGSTTTLVVQFFGSTKVASAAVTNPVIPKVVPPKPTTPKAKPTVVEPKKQVAIPTPVNVSTPVPAATTTPIEQPQVLGFSDAAANPTPVTPHKLIVPIPPVASYSDGLAQNPVSSALTPLLIATFAGYMALFGLAGVMAYLNKSITGASTMKFKPASVYLA